VLKTDTQLTAYELRITRKHGKVSYLEHSKTAIYSYVHKLCNKAPVVSDTAVAMVTEEDYK
jgi:hypothetical protein